MKQCKTCHERYEQHYGKNLTKTYYYCGVIEQAIEDAIECKDITKCARDVLRDYYRVGKYERKPINE
jgi:hypothetical protein